MNSKSLRRLAGDHSSLHISGLPPNYLFPPSSEGSADLTSLEVLLAGPIGTPYVSGVWLLHLDIPSNYPAAPPTAHFRTRLWHPNVDEATGAVCVETLKRDWSSTLSLRDVLVTISCLLIQPNPESALNEAAGKLASEDWDTYCRRARLMTEIHASVPSNIANLVKQAQVRGEDTASSSDLADAHGKTQDKEIHGVSIVSSTSKLAKTATGDGENTRSSKGISSSHTQLVGVMRLENVGETDPFATASTRRIQMKQSFDMRSLDVCPTLLSEFSNPWGDAIMVQNECIAKGNTNRSQMTKGVASNDFEVKQEWEKKRFKDAGYSMARYNRGTLGPRVGVYRL